MPSRASVPSALVALVLLLGVLFRVTGLESKIVWHDEVYTRIFTSGYESQDWQDELFTAEVLPVEQVLHFQRFDDSKTVVDTVRGLAENEPQHPPVFYVLARVWMSVFGDRIGVLRALPAVASLAAMPGMFWLCWGFFRDHRKAWMGAMLASSSPFFVLYAQEAREYAMWGVLVILATAALLHAIYESEHRAKNPLGAWAIYALLVALALYTSFSSAAVAIAHVLYIIIRERGRFTRVSLTSAASLTVSALLFLPWALTLWAHFEAFQASMAWSKIIVIPRNELLSTFALNASRVLIDGWHEYDHAGVYVAVALTSALFVAALVAVVRETEAKVWVLVCLLVGVSISLLLGPDLLWGGIRSVSARYLIPSWIGLQVALAHLLGRKERTGLAAVVLSVGLLSCLSNARQEAVWTKGVSVALPEIAAVINAADRPLVIGNRERHHPGNLHALANLLEDDTSMQLLWSGDEVGYALPEGFGAVFLYSPLPQFVTQLEAEGRSAELKVHHLHAELYELSSP